MTEGAPINRFEIVLLIFVLARVFRKGAEMQDEIEATV